MSEVFIQDLTVRDGNQSLLATRMQREDILTLVEALDKVGFHSLEVWGGATFDSAFRFLKQSSWENLREIRKAAPHTKLSMLLRGQNVVGYRHYDNDTLERFIRLTLENGIDIIRCFDALNDTNNLKNAFRFVKKHGGHLQGAIAYTVSPVHNNSFYVNLAKEFVEMGADSICIKDMAGIITPQNAYELVSALKDALDVPIEMHTHTTANATPLVMLEAMRAGVDVVDGAISPFSGGTSHLADETLVEVAKLAGRETHLNMEALSDAYEIADKMATKYIASGDLRARSLVPNPKILTYQVPGGMLSNLLSQLESQGKGDRFNDVLQEVPHVRKDMGYPPLVTPLSQMVGTQAVMNVIFGERYKLVPKEIKDYVQGFYGRSPAPLDPEAVQMVMKGAKPKTPTDPDDLEPVYDDMKQKLEAKLGREAKEEEVVAYILFPQQVLDFLTGKTDEPAPKAAPKAAEAQAATGVSGESYKPMSHQEAGKVQAGKHVDPMVVPKLAAMAVSRFLNDEKRGIN
ncbi:MAG: pyruvate carboxylase subunit B [Peptoniphilaceae bacterium]|nr:pyruvate carboxylase subunit B [Peptoniphilaceae bacterium]MDY6085405.1 pyruvate carboxylase subunit B [Peptoniphilaceae bacterium]